MELTICISLFLLSILGGRVYCMNLVGIVAQETPYVEGYLGVGELSPRPTSPPQALRQLLRRDAATCGYTIDNGAANVCAESQYCTTIASGSAGVWNCCNPDSCFLETNCIDGDTCPGQSCLTSYLSNSGTWYSRFMCAATGGTYTLVYRTEDTPQYASSVRAAEEASSRSEQAAAEASSRSEEAAASASRSGVAASISAAEAASRASESAAAYASSVSEEMASLRASTAAVTVLVTATNGQVETRVTGATALGPGATNIPANKSELGGGAIAGIVIGSLVGVALLGAGAFIVYRIQKKRKEDADDDHVPQMTGVQVADKQYPQPYYPYPHSQSDTLAPSQY